MHAHTISQGAFKNAVKSLPETNKSVTWSSDADTTYMYLDSCACHLYMYVLSILTLAFNIQSPIQQPMHTISLLITLLWHYIRTCTYMYLLNSVASKRNGPMGSVHVPCTWWWADIRGSNICAISTVLYFLYNKSDCAIMLMWFHHPGPPIFLRATLKILGGARRWGYRWTSFKY